MKPDVALIGPGRVGSAVGKALHLAGYQLVSVVGRSLTSALDACDFIGCRPALATTDLGTTARAQLILLAVPDDGIAQVAARLQDSAVLPATTTLLHFSGVHPAEIMRRPQARTALFSLHPLLPFADRQQAFERLLAGAQYVGEGDAAAHHSAESLCTTLGGTFRVISPEYKHLYHTAACLASNYLVTLVAEAGKLLNKCGIDAENTLAMLIPLLQATLDNISRYGVDDGLTGPIVRGDTGTLSLHLQALAQDTPELTDLYCQLGHRTALLAHQSGRLEGEAFDAMQKALKQDFSKNYS